MPPWHLLETHLLLLAQTAPLPPHVLVCAEQVVLSVQSAVLRHSPPLGFSKQWPPLHLPDRHWLSAVHVVPGQDAIHKARAATAVTASALVAGGTGRRSAVGDHTDRVVAKARRALRVRGARTNSRSTRSDTWSHRRFRHMDRHWQKLLGQEPSAAPGWSKARLLQRHRV